MAKTNKFLLFISYERRDSGGWSLLLYQHLAARFGEAAVFRDNQKLRSGERWKSSLKKGVSECLGFVLVIGPDWEEQRVLDKLHNPQGWVRKEIETALEQRKEIFPVLVGGALTPACEKLPEAIRPAIDEPNHFHFHDGPAWQRDLDRLCADIEARTGIERSVGPALASIKLYDRALARLNRNMQASHLKRAFTQGGQEFLVRGAKKSGFHHFAIRCALDVLVEEGVRRADDAQRVVALNWGRFSDPANADERHEALLRDVSENLLTASATQDPLTLQERIARAIGQTRRPTVIYSTVAAGSRLDAERVEAWFTIWRDIFRFGVTRLVIVILFVEDDWWSMSSRVTSNIASCDARVQPKLGAVGRRDLDLWVESDLRNSAEALLFNKIKRQCKKLYRFRWRRCFDDVGEAVIDTWLAGLH